MKKKLEAELISLAHRILQLKNKQDIAVLQEEARKLYEKLSVLRFVDENFAQARPTIGQADVEEKLEKAFDYEEKVVVGEIPSEEAFEENPAADDVSALVGNLAASKSVANEPFEVSEPETGSDANAAKADSDERQTAEVAAGSQELPSENEDLGEQTSEETESETAETESESEENTSQKTSEATVSSPTLEQGKDFIQPGVSEEIKLAEEANRATEMFWEAKPEDAPAAETNTEVPANSPQDDVFTPKFELSFDDKSDAKPIEDAPAPTFTFDDLLGKDYADPVFVKPEELQQSIDDKAPEKQTSSDQLSQTGNSGAEALPEVPAARTFDMPNPVTLNKDERGVTLNDKLSKGITIGLNDRVAFMKHLFHNSSEDYNRVLSQLITFDNFTDAKDFIDTMVKPDYDNWAGKEEYEQRFMEIIEKRFQ